MIYRTGGLCGYEDFSEKKIKHFSHTYELILYTTVGIINNGIFILKKYLNSLHYNTLHNWRVIEYRDFYSKKVLFELNTYVN